MSQAPRLLMRELGRCDYRNTWEAMRDFTDRRGPDSGSEFWLVEHEPVFTQGQAGRPEHLLDPGDIPVIQTDRGGQITYHGPGQAIIYLLLSLREAGLGVRGLVSAMENTVIDLLAARGITAQARADAPGVYVGRAKIAALGLRVRRGYTYHGLAFNIDMDLEPFSRINPCGYRGMAVTQARDLGIRESPDELRQELADRLSETLGYRATSLRGDCPKPSAN